MVGLFKQYNRDQEDISIASYLDFINRHRYEFVENESNLLPLVLIRMPTESDQ